MPTADREPDAPAARGGRRALGRGPGVFSPTPPLPESPGRAAGGVEEEILPGAPPPDPVAGLRPCTPSEAAPPDPVAGLRRRTSSEAAPPDPPAGLHPRTSSEAAPPDPPAGLHPRTPSEAAPPDPAPASVEAPDLSSAAAGRPGPVAQFPAPLGVRAEAGGPAPLGVRAEVDGSAPPGVRAEAGRPGGGDGRFTVRLVNFEGPFDLLLQLISKHKMDVTEVALSQVTDEFMAHIRAMGADWDLDQTTEFLVVAATLLDLKAARLLPAAEVEDEADLALLEARDLLFARLLQYRAYKRIADIFSERLDSEARRYPRTVGLEAHHAELLPEVVISIGPDGFAKLAVKAMQPKARPQVYVDHIHAPLVSVQEQAAVVVAMLREAGDASFQQLTQDAPDTLTVVARFLALLELYREKAVVLDQDEALGELMVRWSGGDGAGAAVTDEFDRVVEVETA
ncbi:segregation/condensation protein A [Streptomyces sp. NPDC005878]|uniref:segregation and condensation protein A n=1 Tax=Streptomyces sp. NPDC005878 TaxID=3157077 RepID=UPI0033E1DFFF